MRQSAARAAPAGLAAVAVALVIALAGCALAPLPPVAGAPAAPPARAVPAGIVRADFGQVVSRMRPAATQVCLERAPHLDCNFTVVLDDRPGQPPNAFHTREANGRPVIGFTLSLIDQLRTKDEIALVFGHEAAHHIADHLPRIHQQARTGALLGGLVAVLSGVDDATARQIVNTGATVGARRYSKAFELEADRLGAVIAARGGFDPMVGAELFRRIPDPGNQFLGTHPPNAERLREVERAVQAMAAGRPVS